MTRWQRIILSGLLLSLGCAPNGHGDTTLENAKVPSGADGGGEAIDDPPLGSGDGGVQPGCAGQTGSCYTVYAHADHVLYDIDLMGKTLHQVGPFNAPKVGKDEDVITDLAVSPTGIIYVISNTNLYTASPSDGHVTLIGAVTSCGSSAVALTFMPDGNLYAADYKGAFCRIDISATPIQVTQVGMTGSGMAIAGDLVAVADGTLYGTAYSLSDSKTASDNILVKIDPATGQTKQVIGPTGFPKLFGISFALGQVFGFTHDGSGDVVTIDPMSGKGTLFNSFNDPSTGKGISFAGAGVNAMVSPTIN